MKHIRNFFIVTILLASTLHSSQEHETLLNSALTVYNHCFPGDTMYGSYPNARERVIEGNVAMDEGLGFFNFSSLEGDDVFSKESRTIEWHFYNPNENIQARDKLFTKLLNAIDDNPKNFDKLLFIGGVINLVESLSLAEHENEELQRVDTKRIFNKLMYDNVLCNDIDTNSESLNEIRLNTAKKTLSILNKNIPGCENLQWKEFWNRETKGNVEFGNEGLIVSSDGSTCKFEENDKRYKEFVHSLHKNAINADFKILNWSTKNILKRDKKLKF